MPASEHGSRRKRIWELIRSSLGADASESGSRCGRIWEQRRTHLPPRSMTGIGGRGKDMGALEADCNAGKNGLGPRRLGVQNPEKIKLSGSALATEFALRPHNHLLRRQHCSSLCSQSEGHEHVANMASAQRHDLVGFLAVFGRHNIRPPHFASKVSYSASPQGFVAPYYLTKTQIFLDFEHPT